jgi:hypothetical protein
MTKSELLVTFLFSCTLILIKFRPLLRVFSKQRTWRILLVSSRKFLHLFDQFSYAKVFREAQWSTTPRRETGAKNHSVIGVLR